MQLSVGTSRNSIAGQHRVRLSLTLVLFEVIRRKGDVSGIFGELKGFIGFRKKEIKFRLVHPQELMLGIVAPYFS